MIVKKSIVYLMVLLLTAFPASAGDVSINKWVLNVTVHDDGIVEEVIQIEIRNDGAVPLDGFSFVVPASVVTMIYDFGHTSSFTGQVVKQEKVPGGTRITLEFNRSVDTGSNWNGRVGFNAEKWAVKDGSDYSIDIPVEVPQAIVSGKSSPMAVPGNSDVRSQVFLPKGVEVTSISPEPFRILFQNNVMVPTWSPDKLAFGDTISIEASVSEVLGKIVETEEKINELSARIDEAKKQGFDVSNAEIYLDNANKYNNNQALGEYWKKDNTLALEYVGYANDELEKAQDSLSGAGKKIDETTGADSSKQSPGFALPVLMLAFILSVLIMKKNWISKP
ncbi:MAG: hypothetical protein SCH70_03980 [Candidatus Methanoperedens sp.]|nr:hypothetical protein [Candidatus Methanoperedens sp.]